MATGKIAAVMMNPTPKIITAKRTSMNEKPAARGVGRGAVEDGYVARGMVHSGGATSSGPSPAAGSPGSVGESKPVSDSGRSADVGGDGFAVAAGGAVPGGGRFASRRG